MIIGARIKEQRQSIRYTQKMLADKVSVSPQVISNWERGYTEPSADDISKLSEVLECSSDYLLGITNKPNHKMGDHIFKAGMVLKYYTYTWTLKEDMTWDEIAENYHGFPKNMEDYDVLFRVETDLDTNIEHKTVYIEKKKLKDQDEAEFQAFANNPTLQKWYKELPKSKEEDLERLRLMWEILKKDSN